MGSDFVKTTGDRFGREYEAVIVGVASRIADALEHLGEGLA